MKAHAYVFSDIVVFESTTWPLLENHSADDKIVWFKQTNEALQLLKMQDYQPNLQGLEIDPILRENQIYSTFK